jgi:nucleotide-binding universal stress UspA family protein
MDNSDDSFRAAKRTVELLEDQKLEEAKSKKSNLSEIIVFHSTEHRKLSEKIALYIPSSFGTTYTIPPVDYRKLQKEYELHGEKILKKAERLFDKHNIDVETRLITDEKPEDYIEKAIEEEEVDLVVLGSKGEHSKLEQLFTGGIAQKVVNDVPCDILIVR